MTALLAILYPEEPASLVEVIAFWAMVTVALVCALKFIASRLRERDLRTVQPGIPVDEWRRRGMGVQPSQGIVTFQPGQRCPLCHVEHTPTSEAARCDACGTLVHLQCALEVGRCSTLACKGAARRVDAVEGARRDSAVARPDSV